MHCLRFAFGSGLPWRVNTEHEEGAGDPLRLPSPRNRPESTASQLKKKFSFLNFEMPCVCGTRSSCDPAAYSLVSACAAACLASEAHTPATTAAPPLLSVQRLYRAAMIPAPAAMAVLMMVVAFRTMKTQPHARCQLSRQRKYGRSLPASLTPAYHLLYVLHWECTMPNARVLALRVLGRAARFCCR